MTSDDDHSSGGDAVGYCRPPKHARFKPGQSGNPGGRQRRSTQLPDLIRAELDQTLTLREGGRERRVTKREAIVKQLVALAIKGNTKPLQLILAHLEKHRDPDPFVATAEDDAELLRALAGPGDKGGTRDGDH